MEQNYYEESYLYENFMCKAFDNFDNNSNPILHMSNLQKLIRIENGDETFKKYHGSYEKQMAKVKSNLQKAMQKCLPNKKYSIEQKEQLKIQADRIEIAKDTAALRNIIDISLKIIV